MKYKSKNHSKFIIVYHIIFVCKYRKKLMVKYGDDIKQIMSDISKTYDFSIIEMEVDKDHIHIMVESSPAISPLQIVRVLMKIYPYGTGFVSGAERGTTGAQTPQSISETKV